MKKNSNKGFSLVELIIVIAIMAVLIGVLAPQFIKYVEKSKQSTDITNLDSAVEAIKMYCADKDNVGTITVGFNSNVLGIASGADDGANHGSLALSDAGISGVNQKGKWTGGTSPAAPSATITDEGVVTYAGGSQYYTVGTDGAFSAL